MLQAADPDELILDMAFLPIPEAIRRLQALPLTVMREPAVAYVNGDAPPGTLWVYRHQADGGDQLVARVAAPVHDD
jgi:hypothetical protein